MITSIGHFEALAVDEPMVLFTALDHEPLAQSSNLGCRATQRGPIKHALDTLLLRVAGGL